LALSGKAVATEGPNVPSPLPGNTSISLGLAPPPMTVSDTAKSSWPSPLKSPAVRSAGKTPAPGWKRTVRAGWKVPSPLPSSTLIVPAKVGLAPWSRTARSGMPSPLRSATTTCRGRLPTGRFTAGWNEPSPLPSSTLTEFPLVLAVTRSGVPSPLRSADATARAGAGGELRGEVEAAAALAEQDADVAAGDVGGRQVQGAVA